MLRSFGVLAVLLVLCGPALAEPAADEAAIRMRLQAWAEAFNSGDAQRACELFADDVRDTVPDAPEGDKATICRRLERAMTRPGVRLNYAPTIHEVLISGDQAVVRLTWTLTTQSGGETKQSIEQGMDVFRRDPDGVWRIARFIAFTDSEK
jgi:steroid delta-isomerase